jgi:hypothetical protein
MTALAYTVGVLLFVLGLLASVALHEAGHLIPGKLFGVKVTQFFVGFGRTLGPPAAARPSTASRRSRSAATASSSGWCRRSPASLPTG